MTDTTTDPGSEHRAEPTRIAFVCVQNAGRSQMSHAFAEREVERRGLDGRVDLLTGGTHPADRVHPAVVDVMDEVGVDLSGRTPRELSDEELRSCDHVATMGCSTLDLGTATGVEVRDWDLDDPDGRGLDEVREIRDEVERRVRALFDELAPATN
ncbi:low molecular weight phosphatase family protein [Halomarina litorea]|uniref:arsenate-mycothiol transferase ArsC n=1 Tax=Halomarina litorea TaxID=2961595 RepID=UPI0020C3DD6A|nr:low molecular weight phosphatase family protein [Halomarina sp. BCD28]